MRKQLVGYEGLYWIHSDGSIEGQKGFRKVQVGQHGYPVIDLYKNGKRKTCTIHRLLATHFIDNPENLPTVNHKNGIRNDNKLSNLEWCTQQDNIKHAFRTLGRKNNFQLNHPKPSLGKFGKDHHASKPVLQIKEGRVIKEWQSAMDAVRSGFRSSKISECCSGKRKTHGGYQWKYGIA